MQQRRPQSRVIVGVLSLAVLVGAALTSSPAQADTGAGPYFAPPAWDRTLPSAGRFLVLTNMNSQAVLDRETGLVWERSPVLGVSDWHNGRYSCTQRTIGNRKGWRLPSMPELASLVDTANSLPALPTGHPFTADITDANSSRFWSATTVTQSEGIIVGDNAWFVNFVSTNDHVDYDRKASGNRTWCVRGGMNADAY